MSFSTSVHTELCLITGAHIPRYYVEQSIICQLPQKEVPYSATEPSLAVCRFKQYNYVGSEGCTTML